MSPQIRIVLAALALAAPVLGGCSSSHAYGHASGASDVSRSWRSLEAEGRESPDRAYGAPFRGSPVEVAIQDDGLSRASSRAVGRHQ